MALQPGQVLNRRYRIDTQIGQGSQGAVYAGWDLNLNTAIVVKEQRDTTPETTRRFTRQARALANLRHPGLPYVIDHFSLPDQGQYLVSEFINGQDLQSLMVQTGMGLSAGQAFPWLLQMCDALIYLHTQTPALFHRDVKPANIRITPQGKAVLVDYGIGLASDPDHAATAVGDASGKATALLVGNPYTAPEQFDGRSDARSDLYSLAASFYAVLTGRPPRASRARLSGQPLPGLRQLNPEVPPALEAAILQAMALDPEQRFQTVKAFQSALGTAAHPAAAAGTQVVRPVQAPVAVTMKAADQPGHSAGRGGAMQVPRPPLASTLAASGRPSYGTAGGYLSDEEVLPGLETPHADNRTGRIMGIGAGILILSCLLVMVMGGSVYLLWDSPTGVTLNAAQAIAATLTADASLRTQSVQPTALAATNTLPPALALESSATPTAPPTETPTATPTPTERADTWQPCPAIYPSRLYVGDTAMVSQDPPLPNRVRSQATTTSTVLGFIQPGEQVQVIGGPVCSNEWIWWQISSLSTGLTGWTAEGNSQGYWLVPVR